MHSEQKAVSADGRIPILVLPNSITFYADDLCSQKKMLTLYNAYDFDIYFKVLATSPKKYDIIDSGGPIKPGFLHYIVVRHTDVQPCNYGVSDKIRILLYEYGTKRLVGKRDVLAILLETGPKAEKVNPAESENFEQLLPAPSSHPRAPQYGIGSSSSGGPSLIVVLAAVICIAALMLPTEGQDQSGLPSYLQLSVPQKLIFAYTLGLVTMVILRP